MEVMKPATPHWLVGERRELALAWSLLLKDLREDGAPQKGHLTG